MIVITVSKKDKIYSSGTRVNSFWFYFKDSRGGYINFCTRIGSFQDLPSFGSKEGVNRSSKGGEILNLNNLHWQKIYVEWIFDHWNISGAKASPGSSSTCRVAPFVWVVPKRTT